MCKFEYEYASAQDLLYYRLIQNRLETKKKSNKNRDNFIVRLLFCQLKSVWPKRTKRNKQLCDAKRKGNKLNLEYRTHTQCDEVWFGLIPIFSNIQNKVYLSAVYCSCARLLNMQFTGDNSNGFYYLNGLHSEKRNCMTKASRKISKIFESNLNESQKFNATTIRLMCIENLVKLKTWLR